ncbi:MAG TPA: FHA domain-containing protein [Vicinamibacterales bacterium]
MRFTFGDCVLDDETRELSRAGVPRHLGPKAYALLRVLLQARPRVLSKRELFNELWPATAVSESSLSTVVAELRDALGEDPRNPTYIRTVYGYGYAFTANVVSLDTPELVATSAIALCLVWETGQLELRAGSYILGRAPDASVRLDDPTVSRHHARIVVGEGAATLEDLGSRNGTFRNGTRLSAVARLLPGDRLRIGGVPLSVGAMTASGVETVAPADM